MDDNKKRLEILIVFGTTFVAMLVMLILSFFYLPSSIYYSYSSIVFNQFVEESTRNKIDDFCSNNDYATAVNKALSSDKGYNSSVPINFKNLSFSWSLKSSAHSLKIVYKNTDVNNMHLFTKVSSEVLFKKMSSFSLNTKSIVLNTGEDAVYKYADDTLNLMFSVAIPVCFLPVFYYIGDQVYMDIKEFNRNRKKKVKGKC